MDKMISYCGLPCYECGALLATKTDDDDKRREVAELWSKQYSADIKPQDINCDGCLSEGGRLFGHCKVCEIRKCCSEKAIDNCAYCGEYACDKLGSFFQMSPESKKRLDEIHSKL